MAICWKCKKCGYIAHNTSLACPECGSKKKDSMLKTKGKGTESSAPSGQAEFALLGAEFGTDAIGCCEDIYMDYHVSEVRGLPRATQLAWELGQKIREKRKTGI